MADIFISYASADRDRARALAETLATQGWSVWWDRTIPPGRQFDEVIEEELAAAGCVVVLWSKTSVASSWVKTEAADARDRKILVPVLIEDVKLPLEFRRMQAADLSQWRSGPPQSGELFQAIAAQLRRHGQPAGAGGEPRDTADDAPTESSIEPLAGTAQVQRSTAPASSRRILWPAIDGAVITVVLGWSFHRVQRYGPALGLRARTCRTARAASPCGDRHQRPVARYDVAPRVADHAGRRLVSLHRQGPRVPGQFPVRRN